MISLPRFARLLRVALIIVAIWTIFAFFNSSEFYRRGQAFGSTALQWWYVVAFQLTASLTWAVFTPIIIFAAERLPLRAPHRLRNAAAMLLFAVAMSVVRAAVGGAVLKLGEGNRPTLDFIQLSINVRFHRNVFLILLIVGITNLVLAQRRAAERERAQLALRAEVAKAELQQFRAAMQPHFVLATLDAIGQQVSTDPQLADRMLVDLADLLRRMLEFQNRRHVALMEELELIDRHVELRRATTGARFPSRVDVDEELLAARVPPLVLHSVVESALTASGTDSAGLEIRGRARDGMLEFEVRSDEGPAPGDETATEKTRERLRQAFTGGTEINLRHDGRVLVMEMSMPLEWQPAGAEA